MHLSDIRTRSEYKKRYADDQVWFPAISSICAQNGLNANELRRQVLGTHVVFRTGQHVIKLLCPLYLEGEEVEAPVLECLRDLPIPQVVTRGWCEGWPYLILTVLPGAPAAQVWNAIPVEAKVDLVSQIGRILRSIHEQKPPRNLRVTGTDFLCEQAMLAMQAHDETGSWRDWLAGRVNDLYQEQSRSVLLHCDLTDDHVLLTQRNGIWVVSGIIDFGDAMVGDRYYDFVAPLLCFTGRNPRLSRALIEAYGEQTSRRVLEPIATFCLLHRYATLADVRRSFGIQEPEELFPAIWGVS